jgi:methionine-rich copper-binding protein CopC
MRRVAVTALLALATLLGLTTPAMAHNVLVSSDPADGATLDSAPESVTLTFDQSVQDVGNQIAVTGPEGGQWTDGDVQVRGNIVTVGLRPLGPAGEYTIGYRILSADGHPVQGEVTFTMSQAGSGTSAPGDSGAGQSATTAPPAGSTATAPTRAAPSAEGDSSGLPVWVWVVGGVVLLAAGLTVALRMGRDQE